MRSEELRDIVRKTPFTPFVIKMADGSEYPVKHPEFILIPDNSRVIAVTQPAGGLAVLNLTLISAVEYVPDDRDENAA
jgi:hypothetical protein